MPIPRPQHCFPPCDRRHGGPAARRRSSPAPSCCCSLIHSWQQGYGQRRQRGSHRAVWADHHLGCRRASLFRRYQADLGLLRVLAALGAKQGHRPKHYSFVRPRVLDVMRGKWSPHPHVIRSNSLRIPINNASRPQQTVRLLTSGDEFLSTHTHTFSLFVCRSLQLRRRKAPHKVVC